MDDDIFKNLDKQKAVLFQSMRVRGHSMNNKIKSIRLQNQREEFRTKLKWQLKYLFKLLMNSLSGKQTHRLDYHIKCELDTMPAPHQSIQVIIMESPRFVIGLLLFALFGVLGYAKQII